MDFSNHCRKSEILDQNHQGHKEEPVGELFYFIFALNFLFLGYGAFYFHLGSGGGCRKILLKWKEKKSTSKAGSAKDMSKETSKKKQRWWNRERFIIFLMLLTFLFSLFRTFLMWFSFITFPTKNGSKKKVKNIRKTPFQSRFLQKTR